MSAALIASSAALMAVSASAHGPSGPMPTAFVVGLCLGLFFTLLAMVFMVVDSVTRRWAPWSEGAVFGSFGAAVISLIVGLLWAMAEALLK